jgi:hypothetical protein
LKSKVIKRILIGLCALSLFTGLALAPKAACQSVTITINPETDDSYWVWSDEYQCWVWNGPEFQGDYQGHPYSYWHGRHEGGGDREHCPRKRQSGEGERQRGNEGNVEQPRGEQQKAEAEKPKVEQPKAEESKAEKPKAEEKVKSEKPKKEKSKTEKPKEGEKKDESKSKGE